MVQSTVKAYVQVLRYGYFQIHMMRLCRRTYIACALLNAALGFWSGNVLADHAMPEVGSKIEKAVLIGTDQGIRSVPLPEGGWTVVYAKEKPAGHHNDLSPSDLRATVVLVQADGQNLRHHLLIELNTTFTLRGIRTAQLCDHKLPTLFKDAYGSGTFEQRCLTVNHSFGYLSDPQGIWTDVRPFLLKAALNYPTTIFTTKYSQSDRWAHYFVIEMMTSPVAFGYRDSTESLNQSPWHDGFQADDKMRAAFVDDLISYSKKYADILNSAFPTFDTISPVAVFMPRDGSMPSQRGQLATAEVNSTPASFKAQCLEIGFKPDTSAMRDCMKELQSRIKK